MKSSYKKINGIRTRFTTWGSEKKPKLFFLHGWMDMGTSFAFVCQHLSKHFHCIAPDFRGFGKSGHSPNPLGYFFYEYIADVHAIFTKFSPNKKVTIVGHSMGGNIACLYAGTFPQRVSHLINIEGFGIRDMPPAEGPQKMNLWIDGMVTHRFKIYPTLLSVAKRLQKTNPRLPANKALFLAKHLSKKVSGGYQIAADPRHKWIHPYLHRLDNIYAFWQNIEAKVLNVIADETEMGIFVNSKDGVHAEIKRRLKHFPRGSRNKIIKNSGHMIHHEKPQELAQVIANFLGK